MATNIALRISFKLPTVNAKGMLTGMAHKHVVIHDVVADADFGDFFQHDINKLCDLFEEKARNHVVAKNNIPRTLEHLVKKSGVSIARHQHATPVDPHSAAWV